MSSIPDFFLQNISPKITSRIKGEITENKILLEKIKHVLNNPNDYKNIEKIKTEDFEMESKKVHDKIDILLLIERFFHESKSISCLMDSNICKQISGKETILGLEISKTMLRVSATRIFSNPEQSIMELPVNSIDSYNSSKNSIGKFGFGFQSILFWLCESKNNKYERDLIIDTVYNDHGIKKSYICKLFWTNDGLRLNISLTHRTIRKLGTKITLRCKSHELTNENVNLMKTYINKLRFINTGKIILNGKHLNLEYKNNIKVVDITLNNSEIIIRDFAKGIPFINLEKHMLVPSSSSKPRIYEHVIFKNEQIKHSRDEYKLNIIISGVSIKELVLKESGNCLSFEIHLPYNSKLPVSREDVYYTKDSQELNHFKMAMENIIFDLIKENRIGVGFFTTLLKKYSKINKSPFLAEIIYGLVNTLKTFDYMFVPNTSFWRSFSKIEKIKDEIIIYDNSLMFDAEQKFNLILDRFKCSSNIFKSKIVVALEKDYKYYKYTEVGGFSNIVFVKDLNEANYSNAIFTNKGTMLIRKNSKIEPSPMFGFAEKEQNKIDTIFMILKKKFISLKHIAHLINMEKFISTIKDIFYNNNDMFNMILSKMASKLSEIKIQPVYGSDLEYKMKLSFAAGNWETQIMSSLLLISIESYIRISYVDEMLIDFYLDCYPTKIENVFSDPNFYDFIFVSKEERFIDEFNSIIQYSPGKGEIFIMNVIFREIDGGRFMKIEYENLDGSCLFVLNEIRKVIDNFSLEELLKRHYFNNNDTISIYISNRVISPIIFSCKKYLMFKNTPLIESLDVNNETEFLFSCKSLILHSFNNDSIDYTKLAEEYLSFSPNDINIQILEIAVNEGTTKNFAQSVMTELVQNSIDAIRSNKPKCKDIDIEIGTNFISVKDYVGISNIEHILIPFLSNKNPNDPNVTGEMGTGFFNVYRQPYVDYVTIETFFGDSHLLIKGTPVTNKNGYVTDILYNLKPIDEVEEINDYFTKISIYIRQDIELISSLTVEAQLFVDNQLSFIKEADIYLNSNIVTVESELILSDSNFGELFYSDTKITPSFILTNNIPFCKLSDMNELMNNEEISKLIDEYGLNCFSVNLFKIAYEPTQSRTEIKFRNDNTNDIASFLKEGIILHVFDLYIKNKLDNLNLIIENTTSTCNINQVTPNNKNLFTMYKFKESYLKYSQNLNILEILQLLVLSFKSGEISSINELPKVTLLDKIIYHWIKYKDVSVKKTNSYKMNQHIKRERISVPSPELNIFCDIYWEALRKLKKKGILEGVNFYDPPKVFFEEMEDQKILGFFDSSQNKIIINYDSYKPDIFFNGLMNACLKPSNKLDENSYDEDKCEGFDLNLLINSNDTVDFFSTSEPVCLFIHELTHALLNHTHDKTYGCDHSNVSMIIEGKRNLSFYDACINIYILIASDYDLFKNFYNKIVN